MNGFLLESLYPNGWRRSGEVFWRFSDAKAASDRLVLSRGIRAARVLTVEVNPKAIYTHESDVTPRKKGARNG